MTNLEGRVIRRRRALPPPDRRPGRPAVLKRAGRPAGPRPVLLAPTRARSSTSCGGPAPAGSPTTPGISYERIDAEQGVFWPCPSEDHPGTPRLFADGFPTPDGRARFIRVEHRDPAETPDADYPVRADHRPADGPVPERHPDPPGAAPVPVPGRSPRRSCTPTWPAGSASAAADIVELTHPPRRSAVFRAAVTDDIRPDTVFVPFHWGGASAANALTNPALDPHSKMPAFKACAVDLQRIGVPTTSICSPVRQHTEHAAHTRRHAQPAAPAVPTEGPPHAHSEPLPARHLPLRGRRPRQAGPARRRAELPRARTAWSPRRCTSAAATPPTS